MYKSNNTILIIDDSQVIIESLRQILGTEYIIYEADCGESGLSMAEEKMPEVILLDVVMPGMDGYEVITKLKNNEATKEIPVIFITGQSKTGDEERGFIAGAADYIVKPFSPEIVKFRVRNQLKLLREKLTAEYDIMKYKLANDALNIALWDMDVVSGDPINPNNVFTWSQEFRSMLGYSNEKDFPNLLHTWSDLLHPEDKGKALGAIRAHLIDHTGKTPYDIEYRLMVRSGEYRYFHALGTTMRTSTGVPLRVAGTLMDITDRKQMEKALEESNERIRLMLDSTPLCCQLFDSSYSKIDCNEAGVILFGFKDKTEFLHRYPELYPEFQSDGMRSTEKVITYLDEAVAKGRSIFNWEYKLLDGTIMPAEVTLVRIKRGDDYVLAAYTRDLRDYNKMIDEMRRAEIAEESNATKSRFLAMMSHEIRTPMNSVMGFTELALDALGTDVSPHLREYLSKIKDSTIWLLNIVNDILDISKIESGRMELEQIPFDLESVFTRCQSAILPEAKDKGIELNIYVDQLPGRKLVGDQIRLYQALLNLLSNAVKFTDNGLVSFTSMIHGMDNSEVTVYFEVKDTGIGMTSEQIEKVFDPFIQAEYSTTRNYGGTGLGLSITKNIVEQMGGSLNVESIPGFGSTFSFEVCFDTVEADDADSAERTVLGIIEKPHFDGLLLICDDNHMNQEIICEHLMKVGLKTIVAENGKVAVEKVQERMDAGMEPFDLIFMDIFMPVMDGIEATKRINALQTGTPIIALTANIMVSDLEKYSGQGMRDCLGKPFTSQELWHILLKYLTPVGISLMDEDSHRSEEERLLNLLKLNFARSHQTTFAELKKAVAGGEMELAERIAHSLKSNAAQIGEDRLSEVAAGLEGLFSADTKRSIKVRESADSAPADSLMDALGALMGLVLEKLAPMLHEADMQSSLVVLDDALKLEIYKQLQPMLENHNPQCMVLLDDLRSIPEAEDLVIQIEDFEFQKAANALDLLMTRYEEGDLQ